MNAKQAPRAYSYKRFSTPAQAHGDSLRRQTALAQAWADREGVTLDTELNLTDHGVSAYTGANRDVGNLGAFLRAVEEGTVPKGSWLIVESLDRLSREPAADALHTMQGIIRAGVTVVDLSDNGGRGRAYNLESLRSSDGLMQLMAMLLTFARGNQESALKGMRVAERYAEKRKLFASDAQLTKPFTRMLPAWITWSDEEFVYKLIDERAKVLRWIFQQADEGRGLHSIARHLNETGVEPWGAKGRKGKWWHRSYILKILRNRIACGIVTPNKVERIDGVKVRVPQEPVGHRFPAAIDRELFERVNDRLNTTSARGRNAGRAVRNIFSGMLKCRYCDSSVTRVSKGAYSYLICSNVHAKAAQHAYESVPYEQAAKAFLRSLKVTLRDAPRGANTAEMDALIDSLRHDVEAGDDRVRGLLELTVGDKSRAARQALQDAEAKVERVRTDLREAVERRDTLMSTNVKVRFAAVRKACLKEPMDTGEANKALRGAVRRMVMHPKDGRLDVLWHHAEEPQETLFHTSRFDWDGNTIEKQEGARTQ